MENLQKVAKKLKQKVSQIQESEVIESFSGDTFYAPGVGYSQFKQAIKEKRVVVDDFKGASLDDIFEGEQVTNEYGKVYLIHDQVKLDIKTYRWEEAKERLLSTFKLLYGIGPRIESRLKEEGFQSIKDLTDHRRFKNQAQRVLKLINQKDSKTLQGLLRYWLPASHPVSLCLTGMVDLEDVLFFDLESMGLFSRPVILLGLGQASGGQFSIKQYLIRDITEEPTGLKKAIHHFQPQKVLVTYNGRRFDINYIQERLSYYGSPQSIDLPHLDLLYYARKFWGDKLPDCGLDTVEKKILGVERSLDVPSALVPDFYNTYLETGSIGPLIPIIEHNKQDLISLARLLSHLCGQVS